MYKEVSKHFKPESSETDRHFADHFINTPYISNILSDDSDVIFGTKGSGKTALSKALTDLNKKKYLNTSTLNLDSLSFNRLLANLSDLKDVVNEDILKLSRIVWKNTLLNSAILCLSEVIGEGELKKSIFRILNEDRFIKEDKDIKDSDEKVNSTLENILLKIQNSTYDSRGIAALSAEQTNTINDFPLNEKTSQVLDKLIAIVVRTNKKILISVDGLDSIADHSYESRNVIFTGLIDAIYNMSTNLEISDAFIFKAFLPHELTLDANIKIWDSDKHLNNTHYINWSKELLKDFILKRMFKFSKYNSSKFDDVWSEFMPLTINNPIYGVDENTFDYLLRHTLYRPRQLQSHVFQLMIGWMNKSNSDRKIISNYIPGMIARNNIKLAEKVAQQLSLIYDKFIPFMKSWNGSNTSIKCNVFKDRITTFFIKSSDSDRKKTEDIINELYVFGIFGVSKNQNKRDHITKAKDFHFSFVNDDLVTSISSTMNDDDMIAFAPMFREYCGLKEENGYIINPVKKDNYW